MKAFATPVLAVAICLAITGTSPAQYYQTTFNGPPTTTYGGTPMTGDFNNNGLPDLLVGVSLFLDPGVNGILAPSTTLPQPYFLPIAIGDLNGDGNLDVVGLSDNQNQAWIYLGQGNGTFVIQQLPVYFPSLFAIHDLHVGDLNNDGLADVVLLVVDSTTVYMKAYLNGGTQWTPSWSTTLGYEPSLDSLNHDFDGDGNLDLFWFPNYTTYPSGPPTPFSVVNQIYVARGNGAGGFGPVTGYPIGLVPGPNSTFAVAAAIADLDHDGRSDVVLATNASPDLRFFYGSSSLGLQPPVSATWPTNLGPFLGLQGQGSLWHFFAYDADGDGDVDLIRIASFGANPTIPTSPFGMTVQVLSSTGYRTYASTVRQDAIIPAPAGSYYIPADFDQDGDIDLIGVPNVLNTAVYLDNTAIFGTGCSGAGGARPVSFEGDLTLGNAGYFVGVAGAHPFAPAALGVSLGRTPAAGCGVYLNLGPGQLILPAAGFGLTTTDFAGLAIVGIPLPNLPSLSGVTVYSQWFVADPAGALSVGAANFAASQGRTLILW